MSKSQVRTKKDPKELRCEPDFDLKKTNRWFRRNALKAKTVLVIAVKD